MMKSNHSVHSLNYHLILVVKYRKKVITDEISAELLNDFTRISAKYGVTVTEWNYDKDHIHVLFSTKPNTNLATLINTYKSASSRLVKKNHPEIREHLWKEYFWSRSYYIASAGGVSLDTLSAYIQSQGGDS